MKTPKALFTGEARAIAQATAEAIADRGGMVVKHSRVNAGSGEFLRDGIRKRERGCFLFHRGLSGEQQVHKLVEGAIDFCKRIDTLVNHGGVAHDGYPPRLSEDEWLSQ